MKGSCGFLIGSLVALCGGSNFATAETVGHNFNSFLLSESRFVHAEFPHCVPERYALRQSLSLTDLSLGLTEACAHRCQNLADCHGFLPVNSPRERPVCELFVFDKCTESEGLIVPGCSNKAALWLRWRPHSIGFSRSSPLCPISYSGRRLGSSRYRLVSVAGHHEAWLGGLRECRDAANLVKFADIDNKAEAEHLQSVLRDSQVEAAYLGGYFGLLNGRLRWLWQPCREPIADEVLNSTLLLLRHNVTVIAQPNWTGGRVDFAVCECVDPFTLD